MREHQIAINLKAQQFELLQKLARERGFKSVTAYVKQKIVELALGLDDDAGAVDDGSAQFNRLGGSEAQGLIEDLGRIHSDLKTFLGQEAPAAAGATPFDQLPPGVYQTNSGAFAVAPSQSDSARSGQSAAPGPGAADGGLFNSWETNVAAANASGANAGPNPNTNTNANTNAAGNSVKNGASFAPSNGIDAPAPVSQQVLPSNNLGGFGFKLGGFSAAASMNRYQPPVENADRLSGYREVMDDLEELADRAFAISPRLGALDESAPAEPPATARGARSESILVEPLLPTDNETATAAAHSRVARPKPAPVNMVPPISAADLPGPKEMAASAQATRSQPLQQSVPQPIPQPVQQPAPEPVAQPEPQIVAQPVPEPVAQPEPQISAPPPPLPPPPPPLPLPPPPPPPGDDLLSELLDEGLVAHAHTPRVTDRSTALTPAVVPEQQGEVAAVEASMPEAEAEAEAEEASEEFVPAPDTASGAEKIDRSPVDQNEALALALPAGSQAAFAESMKAEAEAEQLKRTQALSGDYPAPTEDDFAGRQEQQSQSGSQSQITQTQTGGQPGVSGGPPPKRRRT